MPCRAAPVSQLYLPMIGSLSTLSSIVIAIGSANHDGVPEHRVGRAQQGRRPTGTRTAVFLSARRLPPAAVPGFPARAHRFGRRTRPDIPVDRHHRAGNFAVFVGLGLGIAAVAMGLAARRWVKRGEATHGGVALAGIVLGMLATVVGLAIGAILVVGLATDQFNEDYQRCLGEHNGHSEYCEQYR